MSFKRTVVFAFVFALIFCVCANAAEMVKNNKTRPAVLYPQNNDKLYSGDSLALRYYAREGEDCCIILSDESGVVLTEDVKSGELKRSDSKSSYKVGQGGVFFLPSDVLEPEKRYSIQVVCDYVASEPVYFYTYTDGEEAIKEILQKHEHQKGLFVRNMQNLYESKKIITPFITPSYNIYKASVEEIAPSKYFKSSSLASKLMETIEVEAWKLDKDGNRYPTTVKLTVNKNLKNNYINAFRELYALAFPIKSVGCYNYRNTHGGRLSEHALGTAVDINPDENYCIYSDGSKVGKFFKPYENPYSVTPEVVNVFKKYGFEWGGNWTGTVDYMHFAYFDS